MRDYINELVNGSIPWEAKTKQIENVDQQQYPQRPRGPSRFAAPGLAEVPSCRPRESESLSSSFFVDLVVGVRKMSFDPYL